MSIPMLFYFWYKFEVEIRDFLTIGDMKKKKKKLLYYQPDLTRRRKYFTFCQLNG